MRKLLLSCLLGAAAFAASAQQVVFNVITPSAIAGPIPFTNNGDGSSWGLADLNDPADAILDTLVVVNDSTPGLNPQGIPIANEGCNPIQNNIAGKIAVIYRNTCGFGLKALNAQNAGAVGVVIINREPALVNMNGGTEGASVTIPVTFISSVEGAAIRAQLDAGVTVTAFIGNKVGYFQNDVGFGSADILVPPSFGALSPLSVDSNEYRVPLGVFTFNYGVAAQTGLVATAEVTHNGNVVYTASSAPYSLNSGDTNAVSFPDFALASYPNGLYEVTYSIALANDDFPFDNSVTTKMWMNDNHYSLVELDTATGLPVEASGIRPATPGAQFQAGMHFMDPNASRMNLTGINFAASTEAGDSLTGKLFEIYVYEWNNTFANLDDPNLATDSISLLYYGTYIFNSDDQDVYQNVPISPALALEDNQRYVFAVSTFDAVFIAHSDNINYNLNNAQGYNQPNIMLFIDTWSIGGWSSPTYPAVVADFVLDNISAEELNKAELASYPNPTTGKVNLLWNNQNGLDRIVVLDLNGREIMSVENFTMNGDKIQIDLSNLTAGTYFLRATAEDGATLTSRVVLNK